MNAANRVVVVVLLLVGMVLCSVLLIVPGPAFGWIAGGFDSLAGYFGRFDVDSASWVYQLSAGICLAAVLNFILILLIVLEVRRPKSRSIRVEKASGGEVLISTDLIADRLRYEIDQLPDVLRVRPKVCARRKGVAVQLYVETAAGIDVPEKAERIVAMTRVVLEDRLGLKLARDPFVHLKAIQYPRVTTTPVKQDAPSPPVLAGGDEEEMEAPGDEA